MIKQCETILKTLFFYAVLLCAILFCMVPCCVISLLPSSWRSESKLYYFFMALFYTIAQKGLLMPITIKGKENLPHNSALYVANHQSALDVILIGNLLGTKFHSWFFKIELCKIPFFGFMARRMNIPVDRTTARKALVSLLEGIKKARCHAQSLIIFPEGGRYDDGKVHDFLWGFAIIARKTGKPVVPIALCDVYKVYPAGSFSIRAHPLTVRIGEPFFIQEFETDEQFIARVHAWFLKNVKD